LDETEHPVLMTQEQRLEGGLVAARDASQQSLVFATFIHGIGTPALFAGFDAMRLGSVLRQDGSRHAPARWMLRPPRAIAVARAHEVMHATGRDGVTVTSVTLDAAALGRIESVAGGAAGGLLHAPRRPKVSLERVPLDSRRAPLIPAKAGIQLISRVAGSPLSRGRAEGKHCFDLTETGF
jgi:hypothetical protein